MSELLYRPTVTLGTTTLSGTPQPDEPALVEQLEYTWGRKTLLSPNDGGQLRMTVVDPTSSAEWITATEIYGQAVTISVPIPYISGGFADTVIFRGSVSEALVYSRPQGGWRVEITADDAVREMLHHKPRPPATHPINTSERVWPGCTTYAALQTRIGQLADLTSPWGEADISTANVVVGGAPAEWAPEPSTSSLWELIESLNMSFGQITQYDPHRRRMTVPDLRNPYVPKSMWNENKSHFFYTFPRSGTIRESLWPLPGHFIDSDLDEIATISPASTVQYARVKYPAHPTSYEGDVWRQPDAFQEQGFLLDLRNDWDPNKVFAAVRAGASESGRIEVASRMTHPVWAATGVMGTSLGSLTDHLPGLLGRFQYPRVSIDLRPGTPAYRAAQASTKWGYILAKTLRPLLSGFYIYGSRMDPLGSSLAREVWAYAGTMTWDASNPARTGWRTQLDLAPADPSGWDHSEFTFRPYEVVPEGQKYTWWTHASAAANSDPNVPPTTWGSFPPPPRA
ncbi:hypothetical protein [Mycetocola reblochoni]|uniref:hypothetical protein n=1 Tax=Mycetocola reblochoni TaxID=331618 RepID=UPI003F9B48F7